MSGEFAGTGDKGAHYHRCDLQVHSVNPGVKRGHSPE